MSPDIVAQREKMLLYELTWRKIGVACAEEKSTIGLQDHHPWKPKHLSRRKSTTC